MELDLSPLHWGGDMIRPTGGGLSGGGQPGGGGASHLGSATGTTGNPLSLGLSVWLNPLLRPLNSLKTLPNEPKQLAVVTIGDSLAGTAVGDDTGSGWW